MCTLLGIQTPCTWSRDWAGRAVEPAICPEPRTRRLLEVCLELGATEYWSGPAARSYLDESAFARHGIEVRYHDYGGDEPYPQLWGPYEPAVSVVDLLFNVGVEQARAHMKTFGD